MPSSPPSASPIPRHSRTLRHSAVHAGRLIIEAEAGECSLENLLLDTDDPTALFLALFGAVKSGKQETQAAP